MRVKNEWTLGAISGNMNLLSVIESQYLRLVETRRNRYRSSSTTHLIQHSVT